MNENFPNSADRRENFHYQASPVKSAIRTTIIYHRSD